MEVVFICSIVIFGGFFIISTILSCIRIVNQYQFGLVNRLGRISRVLAPGLTVVIPYVDKVILIDTRTVTLPIQSQKIITKDNVSIDVAGVAYFRIVDPQKSYTTIIN